MGDSGEAGPYGTHFSRLVVLPDGRTDGRIDGGRVLGRMLGRRVVWVGRVVDDADDGRVDSDHESVAPGTLLLVRPPTAVVVGLDESCGARGVALGGTVPGAPVSFVLWLLDGVIGSSTARSVSLPPQPERTRHDAAAVARPSFRCVMAMGDLLRVVPPE